jgi:hypothetical protein
MRYQPYIQTEACDRFNGQFSDTAAGSFFTLIMLTSKRLGIHNTEIQWTERTSAQPLPRRMYSTWSDMSSPEAFKLCLKVVCRKYLEISIPQDPGTMIVAYGHQGNGKDGPE